jgi:transaldolase
MMNTLEKLRVKIFADGADWDSIMEIYREPYIAGFTTNPTLMRKAGVAEYEAFCKKLLALVPDRPISFEVLADDFDEMEAQAWQLASWGRNVNVKIPIANTRGQSACPLIARLSSQNITVNVTAVMTLRQVREAVDALAPGTPGIISVFAGRIADTGIDPVPVMSEALTIMRDRPRSELLWASPRELLNIIQANKIGCHIITVTGDLLRKLSILGKDLEVYSLETVDMFYRDAMAASYIIRTTD